MLCVHGRLKEQNKQFVGECNWGVVKQIKEALKIPVILNGGIGSKDDVERCMKETGVDGVMSSEAILENPPLTLTLTLTLTLPLTLTLTLTLIGGYSRESCSLCGKCRPRLG